MAAFETTRVHHSSNGQFVQFFANLFANVAHWNTARKTRIALSKLTDRELLDVGLIRGDIHSIQ